MSPRTSHQRLEEAVSLHGDRVAYYFGDAAPTYKELQRRVDAVCDVVSTYTEPGDVVAMKAWNGPWWVEALFGVPKAARRLAFVSPRLTPAEVGSMLDNVGARLVIDGSVGAEVAERSETRWKTVSLTEWGHRLDEREADGPRPDPPTVDEDAIAWLMFTSGTTGRPKAAAHSHRTLLAAIDVLNSVRPSDPDDVYLFPFPLWHIATYNVIAKVLSGRPTVISPRFDADGIVRDVIRRGTTSMSVAATMLDTLVSRAESDSEARDALAGLREIYYGAAPMPLSLLRRAEALLGVDFWQGYGMTELGGNAVFLSPDEHRKLLRGSTELAGATGRPAPGVELRIDAPAEADLTTGEILVRSEQVMVGYFNDVDATEAALTEDGWLRTGDIGSLSADGLLRVLDRKKDIVITGGENVSAREVEEVLREHVAIRDVAVFGVPDDHWGECVCAVFVPESASYDVSDIELFARTRLAGFKVPRRFAARDELPVNAAGKVVKAELQAWFIRETSG